MDGLRAKITQYYGHVVDDVKLLSTLRQGNQPWGNYLFSSQV